MNDYICFLITIFYESDGTLIKCALKCKRDAMDGDWVEYPMEDENKDRIWKLLPAHVRNCGRICEVEKIFEIHTVSEIKGDRE